MGRKIYPEHFLNYTRQKCGDYRKLVERLICLDNGEIQFKDVKNTTLITLMYGQTKHGERKPYTLHQERNDKIILTRNSRNEKDNNVNNA